MSLKSPSSLDYDAAFRAVWEVQDAARAFIPPDGNFISLGQNCNAAHYLKAVGKKYASYPFDWVFSSPKIAAHCIEDRFRTFLDRDQMINIDMRHGGHKTYHRSMFNHRNPLTDDNYAYYRRCVSRFLDLFDGPNALVFVSVALPEHRRRSGWSTGFGSNYGAPSNTDIQGDYAPLLDLVARRTGPTKVVVFKQRTLRPRPGVGITHQDNILLAVDVDACGSNNGVHYTSTVDDSLFRTLVASLVHAPRSHQMVT